MCSLQTEGQRTHNSGQPSFRGQSKQPNNHTSVGKRPPCFAQRSPGGLAEANAGKSAGQPPARCRCLRPGIRRYGSLPDRKGFALGRRNAGKTRRIPTEKVRTAMVDQDGNGTVRSERQVQRPVVNPRSLPIAVRVFPDLVEAEETSRSRRAWRCPEAMLVFRTVSRKDATQKLMSGVYRLIVT